MEKRLDISVVVPLYNEEESLPELTAWIDRVARENGLLRNRLVDDGSTTARGRRSNAQRTLCGRSGSPATGKSAALYCGKATWFFTMDADFQLARRNDMMILEEGHDMVSGWKLKFTTRSANAGPANSSTGRRAPSRASNSTTSTATESLPPRGRSKAGEMHLLHPDPGQGGRIPSHRREGSLPGRANTAKFGMERMVKGYLDRLRCFPFAFRPVADVLFRRVGDAHVPAGRLLDDLDHRRQVSTSRRTACRCCGYEQPLFYLSMLWSSSACSFFWPVSGRADQPQRLRPQQIPDRQKYLTNTIAIQRTRHSIC